MNEEDAARKELGANYRVDLTLRNADGSESVLPMYVTYPPSETEIVAMKKRRHPELVDVQIIPL